MNDNVGSTGTELTLNHLQNMRRHFDEEASRPPVTESVCLLCYKFAGNHSEMALHWLDDHGIDPAKALYGA